MQKSKNGESEQLQRIYFLKYDSLIVWRLAAIFSHKSLSNKHVF